MNDLRHLPALIGALLDPLCYPEPARKVDLVETHASWLLLAGAFAYKIKKAITLPFLDYATLERRRACCEAELRLNRRFAEDLYLSVVPIGGSPEEPQVNGTGPAIEFAVKMRRFAEAGRLDHLCARGQLGTQLISDLAEVIGAFHQAAACAPPTSRFGEPDLVLRPALENFIELRELLPNCGQELADLKAWTEGEFIRLRPKFVARKGGERVRECHGDLHLANLVLIDKRVTPFDCVEFSDDLRWIDVANEIAFPYIDLMEKHQPGLAGWLLNEWLTISGDYDAASVLRYYAVYRALVLAKVAAIRARQAASNLGRAKNYLVLAERLATPPAARLIITHGLAGCGKSRAAKRLLLHDPLGATLRLRSDVERKRLYGFAANAGSSSPVDGGVYGREASDLTYRRLYDLTRDLLHAGWSVVVDAAFLERSRRDMFRQLARQVGVHFAILAPTATPAQLRLRILGRLAKGADASEATLAVLRRQQSRIETLSADELDDLLSTTAG